MLPRDLDYFQLSLPSHGMFHLREHSLSFRDKMNAGTKPATCKLANEQFNCVVLFSQSFFGNSEKELMLQLLQVLFVQQK